jgi:DNA-binding beta-propeller fold protein YncE
VPSPVACDPATSCKTGSTPLGIAIDPTGSHAYVANNNSGSVSVFSIAAGGALSPVACDPATSCKTGAGPEGIAVDPTGKYVYVTNANAASVSVFSIGVDGALTPVACDPATSCRTGTTPEGIAVDPAGRYVYVTSISTNSVSAFTIGSGGALSPVTCDPATACATGTGPEGIAIDPSATHVYVSDYNSGSVSAFSIGVGGALVPIACDPTTICKTGTSPSGIAVDSSGQFVFVTNVDSDSVSVFLIGPTGALAPVTCDPATACKTGANPYGVAADPAGTHLYVSNKTSNSVSAFSIGASGALSPLTCDPATTCSTGTNPQTFSLAVSPDRGPTAALVATAARAGGASAFDATGSSSPDYPIVKYAWDFGDGEAQTTPGPTLQHTYAAAGTYTVTVTVADQAKCGLALIYTGQTASCGGSSKARVTQSLIVPPPVPPAPVASRVALSPKAFRAAPTGPSARAAKKRRRVYGAKVSYRLNVAARVRFTVRRFRNKSRTRTVAVKGSFSRAGIAGKNRFRFTGRLRGKRLPPGRYRLVVTPSVDGVSGTAGTAKFAIIR